MSEVDDRKAAIRAARAVAGEYRKRANVPVSDDDIYALRIASDQASTADLLEGLANLLSLTPTQPDRDQIALAYWITQGYDRRDFHTADGNSDRRMAYSFADEFLRAALFNGGTKP